MCLNGLPGPIFDFNSFQSLSPILGENPHLIQSRAGDINCKQDSIYINKKYYDMMSCYWDFVLSRAFLDMKHFRIGTYCYCSSTTIARTLMARSPRLFQTRSWVPWKKIPSLRIWANLGCFSFFILIMVYCLYPLESPLWGDSNKNTQYTFIFKKIEKISVFCLLT